MRKTVYILLMMLLFSGLFTMAQVIEHKPRQQERQKPKVEKKQKPLTTHQKETPKSSNSDSKQNQSGAQNKNKQQKTSDKKAPEKKTEKVSANDNMTSKVQEKNKTSKPSEKKELPKKTEKTPSKDKDKSIDDKKKDPFGNVKDIDYDKYFPKDKDKKKTDTNDQDLRKPTRSPKKEYIIQQVVNDMVYVNGGTFVMGGTVEQGNDAFRDESPAHQVKLNSYYISKYEVTQELWQAVMDSNPSSFKGNLKRPVELVSWNDCQEFITKLNRLTGKQFRLPTEAEWEYAARGGNKSRKYKYAGSNILGNVAWYIENSDCMTHPVGTKSPNELGLYDMSGNVWEWCQDWYSDYNSTSQTNPSGPHSGTFRVYRGGCWIIDNVNCRVSYRYGRAPSAANSDIGLRLAATSL